MLEDVSQTLVVLGHLYKKINGRKKSTFSLFSLNKIVSLKLLEEKFILPKDFDADAYFANYFRVIVFDGTNAERVVIRAHGNEAKNMKCRPLHHSQKCLKGSDNSLDFEFFLCSTTSVIILFGEGPK